MMIIDVTKHILQKKYSDSVSFEYAPPARLLTVPLTDFEGPARANLEYWLLEDDSVEVKGFVEYTLVGSCSRCLSPARKVIRQEISVYFVPSEEKRVGDDDYVYAGGTIDLRECVDDAIILGMPYSLLCSENCAGIEYRN